MAGARSVTSVDLSARYLAWGEDNFARNDLQRADARFVQADCMEYLARTRERFDVVLLNPPTYSRSHRAAGDFDLRRDHEALLRAALDRTAPGGELFFVTHARGFELAPSLRESPFLLTTVDAIAARGALPALASSGMALGPCGTLAVTSYVDDEKPLWARLGVNDEILALGAAAADSGWVTSGAYFFHPSVYRHVAEARRRQLGRLRDFLALLLERGESLWAHRGGDSIDVDRPQDIAAAERFLETHA